GLLSYHESEATYEVIQKEFNPGSSEWCEMPESSLDNFGPYLRIRASTRTW
ncbi:hypothetical protein AVEN_144135-1, partial [Araneus ventricosus]